MKRTLPLLFALLFVTGLFLSACTPKPSIIYVATDANWEPFEYFDPITGEIIGLDIDLMKAIAEETGLQIEFVDVRWTPLLEGMAQCQFDAAISSMTVTEERSQQFSFSDPYMAAGQVVTVRSSNTDISSKDDLSGKIVGVQLDTTGEAEVRQIPGVDVRTYEDIGVAFDELLGGSLDAVVADSPLVLTYVGQNQDSLKMAGDVFTDEVYAIAVCKTKAGLLEQINRGLAIVKSQGLIDTLIQKWMFNK